MSALLLIYLVILGYIYYTIYYVNYTDMLIRAQAQEQAQGDMVYHGDVDRRVMISRLFLLIAVSMMGFLMFYWVMLTVSIQQIQDNAGIYDLPNITFIEGLFGMVLTTTSTFIGYSVAISAPFRAWIRRYLPAYDPKSWVHNTAIIFMLLLLTAQVVLFLSQGGTEAMAQSIERQGINPTDLFLQLWLQVIAAFLGVGWLIRRNLPVTLTRLGLRLPTKQDWAWGIGGAVGLLGLLWVFGIIVSIVVLLIAPDQMDAIQATNRANESITLAVSTVPLALLLSGSAAIGEEILFRGALQPIFGNLLISIFFAILHTQVLLSPAILLLVAVSYGLGIIRQRASTTAAIIAHFLYNFLQLMLAIFLASSLGGV